MKWNVTLRNWDPFERFKKAEYVAQNVLVEISHFLSHIQQSLSRSSKN